MRLVTCVYANKVTCSYNVYRVKCLVVLALFLMNIWQFRTAETESRLAQVFYPDIIGMEDKNIGDVTGF